MSMQSLKEIGQKILKLEIGNEALMDGRTLKWFGGYNIIPATFCVARYKHGSLLMLFFFILLVKYSSLNTFSSVEILMVQLKTAKIYRQFKLIKRIQFHQLKLTLVSCGIMAPSNPIILSCEWIEKASSCRHSRDCSTPKARFLLLSAKPTVISKVISSKKSSVLRKPVL